MVPMENVLAHSALVSLLAGASSGTFFMTTVIVLLGRMSYVACSTASVAHYR